MRQRCTGNTRRTSPAEEKVRLPLSRRRSLILRTDLREFKTVYAGPRASRTSCIFVTSSLLLTAERPRSGHGTAYEISAAADTQLTHRGGRWTVIVDVMASQKTHRQHRNRKCRLDLLRSSLKITAICLDRLIEENISRSAI